MFKITKNEFIYKNNCVLAFFLIIGIAIGVLVAFFWFGISDDIKIEFIKGAILLAVAYITAMLSIQKYHKEQRASRIQKLYFEESFLGQIKAMEETMSHITKNFNHVKTLLIRISEKNDLSPNFKRKVLLEKIDIAEKNMTLNVIKTDFKKETISSFFYKTGYYNNKIPSWIKKFEDDAFSFQDFLGINLVSFKNSLLDIDNLNDISFKLSTERILNDLNRHYLLVDRHYRLFTLLSEIVLGLSNESYKSISELEDSFQKDKYKKVIQFSDCAYKD